MENFKSELEMFVEEDVRHRANFLENCKGYLSEADDDDLSEKSIHNRAHRV